MDRNIGGFDRAARVLVAAPLAFIGWEAGRKHHGKTRAVALAAATEVIASSVTGYSPLYAALGFSTKTKPETADAPVVSGG
jgi:hypothetical protein